MTEFQIRQAHNAFEDHYERCWDDPSSAEMLGVWMAAWEVRSRTDSLAGWSVKRAGEFSVRLHSPEGVTWCYRHESPSGTADDYTYDFLSALADLAQEGKP